MQAHEIVTTILLALGCLVSMTGAYGLLRMPDFYTRLHTAGKTDSLGQFLIFLGFVFVTLDLLTQFKLVMVAMMLWPRLRSNNRFGIAAMTSPGLGRIAGEMKRSSAGPRVSANQKKPTSTRLVAASSLPVAFAGAWRSSKDSHPFAIVLPRARRWGTG